MKNEPTQFLEYGDRKYEVATLPTEIQQLVSSYDLAQQVISNLQLQLAVSEKGQLAIHTSLVQAFEAYITTQTPDNASTD